MLDRAADKSDEQYKAEISAQRPLAERVEGMSIANENIEAIREEIEEIEANASMADEEKSSLIAVKKMQLTQLEAKQDKHSQD